MFRQMACADYFFILDDGEEGGGWIVEVGDCQPTWQPGMCNGRDTEVEVRLIACVDVDRTR